MIKTLLNGVISQDKDDRTETVADLRTVTERSRTKQKKVTGVCRQNRQAHQIQYHCTGPEGQLLSSGVGQTSRVDALKQAIEKARSFGFDLNGSVMASDAFSHFRIA